LPAKLRCDFYVWNVQVGVPGGGGALDSSGVCSIFGNRTVRFERKVYRIGGGQSLNFGGTGNSAGRSCLQRFRIAADDFFVRAKKSPPKEIFASEALAF
jgi:hypothetical protein